MGSDPRGSELVGSELVGSDPLRPETEPAVHSWGQPQVSVLRTLVRGTSVAVQNGAPRPSGNYYTASP